jgi:hypothetical protein
MISLPARNEYGTDVWNLRRHTNYLPIADKVCQSQKCKSLHIIVNFCHIELQNWRGRQIMPHRYISIRSPTEIQEQFATSWRQKGALRYISQWQWYYLIYRHFYYFPYWLVESRCITPRTTPTSLLPNAHKTVTLVSTSSRLHKQSHIVPQGHTKSIPVEEMFRIRRKVPPNHSFTRARL